LGSGFCTVRDQCFETSAWFGSLPKSWRNRLPVLGRLGCDRRKSRGARTNVTIEAIRLLKYGNTKYHFGAKH